MYQIISVDPKRCTGCRICELACSLHNTGQCDPTRARIHASRRVEDDLYWHVPLVCQRCTRAVCVEACEAGALTQDETTGTIILDETKCTACGACAERCLFAAIGSEPLSGRPLICAFCDGEPRCASLCPSGALTVADSDDPKARSGRTAMSRERKRLRIGVPAAAGPAETGV